MAATQDMLPSEERERRVEQRDIGLSGIAISSDRMRALRPEVVKELANSMRKQGLLFPVLLRPIEGVGNGYILIAGAHRYHAAKKLGWKHIAARIFHGWSDADALLAEIDENLCRAELTASQRAKFTAARKKAYLQAHPETKKGGDRRSKLQNATLKKHSAFIDETSAKTGKHRATIARDVARAEALGDDIDQITGTSLDKGIELDALARMAPAERSSLIERAVSGEEVSAVDAVGTSERSRYTSRLDAPRRKRTQYVNNGFRILNCLSVLRSMPAANELAVRLTQTQRGFIANDLVAVVDWLNALRIHLDPNPVTAAIATIIAVHQNAPPGDRKRIRDAVRLFVDKENGEDEA